MVKKAVIPVAGLGTRFLPITKSFPKEMLPIVDTPLLFYIVDEAVKSGIEEVIFVVNPGKNSIKEFFDRSPAFEKLLRDKGRAEAADQLQNICTMARFTYAIQSEARGLGHAVYSANAAVGNDPFALLLGDEILVNEPPVTKQLISIFQEQKKSVTAVMPVEKSEIHKYGVIEKTDIAPGVFKVLSVVEKPKSENAPSNLALPGRYVFSPQIFEHLKSVKPGTNGEIQLTDGMTMLAQKEGLLAGTFTATRYDTGDKFGYLKANIELGMSHPDVGQKLKAYIKDLAKTL